MSRTHVFALDRGIQEANTWLARLVETYGFDDHYEAYEALRAVLHALRDTIAPDEAVHLGERLPIIIRGVYYEGWRPADGTADGRFDHFLTRVAAALPESSRSQASDIAETVFEVMRTELGDEAAALIGAASQAQSGCAATGWAAGCPNRRSRRRAAIRSPVGSAVVPRVPIAAGEQRDALPAVR